jgi:segregation and condensation protein B
MEREQALRVIETLLYMTDHPLPEKEIVEILGYKSINEEDVQGMIKDIADKLDATNSPLQIVHIAGGVQMATRPDMATWIRRLYKERLTVRLSPSALETLSIIAYKQPIARSEIEQIRGVEASGVMETLVERRLVKVVGRKETIGRPLLYGTSQEFLRQFGLKHLSELPDLASLPVNMPVSPEPDLPTEELVGVAAETESAPSVDAGAEASEAASETSDDLNTPSH